MLFLGDVDASDLVTFEASRKRRRSQNRFGEQALGYGQLGGAALVTKASIDSGLPRALGIRLERHSASRKAAEEILKNGGYIDPSYSGRSGIRMAEGLESVVGNDFAEKAKGYAYISGYHPQAKKRVLLAGGKTAYEVLPDDPIRNVIYRKVQSLGYRAQSEVDYDKFRSRDARVNAAQKNVMGAILGSKGKTLYAPGTDEYFAKAFEADIDDPIAMRSPDKVRVYGNRLEATVAGLRKHGLSGIRGNPRRVLVGLGVLTGGGAVAYGLGRSAVSNISGPDGSGNPLVSVKGFVRRGRSVKGYKRKRNKR